MYEEHFGLSRRPFGETLDPCAYVAVPSRETVLRRVRYGLDHGRGPALVFGPSGTGKTLLARVLIRDLAWPAAHLTFPAMPAAELLAVVVDGFPIGSPPPSHTPSISVSVGRFRRWLAASAQKGERPLLVVDEAQLIDDPATFEALRLLLNFATNGPPDLSLLLVGSPEILLRLPPPLADRLTARCLLGPFTEAESSSYLLGRSAAAGASVPLFAPEAIAALHRAADGLPRRIDRLADLSLLIAYSEGLPQADLRTVTIAAREADFDALAA